MMTPGMSLPSQMELMKLINHHIKIVSNILQILSITDTESQIHGASCHIGNILEIPYKSLCNPLQQAQEIDCFFKD